MKCATKEELQRNCSGAWDAYRSAIGDPEPEASAGTGSFLPPHFRGLGRLGYKSEAFLDAVKPFRQGLVVGCECMFAWYWLADLCEDHEVPSCSATLCT